jgi:hypothetical protein
MCITHKVDTLAALLHFVKVVDYVITFFGGKAIERPYINNEGLMPSVVMHAFEAFPHLKGSLALAHMDHLSIHEVALNLHASKNIIGAPVMPALEVNAKVWALNSTCDILKHTAGFKCSSYFGLPDNLVGLIKIASKSYH